MTAGKYNTMTTQSRNDQERSRDAGLRQRFERDVVPLREILYRHAFRLSQNHADAEDLQQETMLRAYAAFHSFQEDTNLNAWLLRILTNSYIDGYRKKRRQPVQYCTEQVTDQDLAEARAQGRPSQWRSAEDEVIDALPDTEIGAAIEALPRQFREVVYYADVEGFLQGDRSDHENPERNCDIAAPARPRGGSAAEVAGTRSVADRWRPFLSSA